MKKLAVFSIFFLSLTLSMSAQRQGRRFEQMLEQYKSERVAYLTREVELSVAEAEKFWPVYNEYQEKREELMRASRPNLRHPSPDSLTVKQMEEFMNAKIINDLNLAELAEEYHKKFIKLLGVKKVFSLYHAEQEFMGYMIRQMRNHDDSGYRQGRGGDGGGRPDGGSPIPGSR